MGLSTSRLRGALVGFGLSLAALGCSQPADRPDATRTPSDPQPQATTSVPETPGASPTPDEPFTVDSWLASDPATGAGIAVPADAARVMQFPPPDYTVSATAGGVGDRVLLARWRRGNPDSDEPHDYHLVDLVTGAQVRAWEGERGTQDIVWRQSGDWAVTFRTGYSLPFAGWRLIIRNLSTGESREIAAFDPRVQGYPGSGNPGLGFAPLPSASGDTVVWTQLVYDETAGVARPTVLAYSISSREFRTLFAGPGDGSIFVGNASVSGHFAAWVTGESDADPALTVVDLLDESFSETWTLKHARPYTGHLFAEGRGFVWGELAAERIYVLDRHMGDLKLMPVKAWEPVVNDRFASWVQGFPGYYDIEADEVRFVEQPGPLPDGERQGLGGRTITDRWLIVNYIRTDNLGEVRELTAHVFIDLEAVDE